MHVTHRGAVGGLGFPKDISLGMPDQFDQHLPDVRVQHPMRQAVDYIEAFATLANLLL